MTSHGSTESAAASPSGPPTDADRSSRRLTPEALEELCARAVRAAGGSEAASVSLARATIAAEQRGRTEVGAAHLLDYLDALCEGRLDGSAEPRVVSARAGTLTVDAAHGTAQAAFDLVCDDLVRRARDCGVAVLSIHRSFPAGEIGYYTTRIAEHGLVALAGSNSPALMSALGARDAVTGTNPMSFALPHLDGPRMFDQAASATAWVNIRDAAEAGERIPEDWALDAQGEPTTDPAVGMAGALLPFGGAKAGNIAFMVEMLAAMSGGAFSLDAPPFDSGHESPSVGLFAIAIDPTAFDPDYPSRAEAHLRDLTAQHGVDFGRRKAPRPEIDVPARVYEALTRSLSTAGSPAPHPTAPASSARQS